MNRFEEGVVFHPQVSLKADCPISHNSVIQGEARRDALASLGLVRFSLLYLALFRGRMRGFFGWNE